MVCKNVARLFHKFLYVLYIYFICMYIETEFKISQNEHTKNTESNPFNKPKRDTMS